MNNSQTVFIVDDDEGVRDGLSLLLATVGQQCELYDCGQDFFDRYDDSKRGCLVLDIRMPTDTGRLTARKSKTGSQNLVSGKSAGLQ